jgi:nucleotide-binding universal stress UspA family protein
MSNLDEQRVQQSAQRSSVDLGRPTRYSEAINRYLDMAGHRVGEPVPSAPAAERPTANPEATTGVVVVGVDDTPASCVALDHAAIEAEVHGWELRILHVQHIGALRRSSHDAGVRLLERLTDRVRAYWPSLVVTSRLATGSAPALLLADARNADLVVVGHQHGAAGTAIGLSVAERVATLHAGTVMIVRAPGWPPGPEFGGRPIVVGVDQGGARTPAVEFALQEARQRGCDVVVLHAGRTVVAVDQTHTDDEVRVRRLDVAADAADALVDFSGEAAAVVLGRRHSGIPIALLGSVSRAVVQHAHCPIFLVG